MASPSSVTVESTQREVAIFWDYENVPLPGSVHAATAAKAIVDAVSHHGRIVDRRVYYDFSKPHHANLSSLDSSGFDLVNTPSRNQKETLDKKLIADVLTFAWDSADRAIKKPCVVLLTGDGDYAYTLSKLNDRKIQTVVITGRNCTVASILTATADEALSLEDDVLHKSARSGVSPTKSGKNGLSVSTAPTKSPDEFVALMCETIHRTTNKDANGWCDFGGVASVIQGMLKGAGKAREKIKIEARAVRDKATKEGWIELGRRRLDTPTRVIATRTGTPMGNVSNEIYARLTPQGESLVAKGRNGSSSGKIASPSHLPTKMGKPTSNSSKCWFLRNVPLQTKISELVQFLENSCQVQISRARLELPKPPRCLNAHVETQGSGTLLSQLVFHSTSLSVYPNSRSNPFPNNISKSPELYYKCHHNEALALDPPPPLELSADDERKCFCRAVYHAGSKAGSWINSGVVGTCFLKQLPKAFVQRSAKEQKSVCFKDARKTAIEGGLVEMGRRRLDGTDTFVAVPLDGMTMSPGLSPEFYFRLLAPGHELVSSTELGHSMTDSTTTPSAPSTPASTVKSVYLNGLPTSDITAKEVVGLIESRGVPVRRAELESKIFKGADTVVAHVEPADTDGVQELLRMAKSNELVYCGRNLYAAPDHYTPDEKVASDLQWSYTAAPSPINTSITFQMGHDSTLDDEMSDTICSHKLLFQSKSSDDQNEAAHLLDGEEDEHHHLMDEIDKIIMQDNREQNDPFADLLSM